MTSVAWSHDLQLVIYLHRFSLKYSSAILVTSAICVSPLFEKAPFSSLVLRIFGFLMSCFRWSWARSIHHQLLILLFYLPSITRWLLAFLVFMPSERSSLQEVFHKKGVLKILRRLASAQLSLKFHQSLAIFETKDQLVFKFCVNLQGHEI